MIVSPHASSTVSNGMVSTLVAASPRSPCLNMTTDSNTQCQHRQQTLAEKKGSNHHDVTTFHSREAVPPIGALYSPQ